MHRTHVRASIAFHLSCIAFVCYACLYLLFIPPLLLSGSLDDRCRCPCDRLRRRRSYPLPSSFQASRATSPLPHIAYFSIFICWTRHMLLLRYFPIQMHSLSLSPFDVPFLNLIAAYIIYIIYSAGPCALLDNRIS